MGEPNREAVARPKERKRRRAEAESRWGYQYKTDTSTVKRGELPEEPCEGKLQARFCEGTGSVIG